MPSKKKSLMSGAKKLWTKPWDILKSKFWLIKDLLSNTFKNIKILSLIF